MDRREAVRRAMLMAVVFAATLAILFGLSAVARVGGPGSSPTSSALAGASVAPDPSGGGSAVPGSSGPAPSIEVAGTQPPGEDPVLVGAGDIAACDSDRDEATAALLDGFSGTVFTAGDNAYPDGTADQFRDCYGPSWGRHLARTWPVAGNHDWRTSDLAGYRGYFGAAAGDDDASWYARDLGTWRVIVLDSDCAAVDGCGPDSPQGRWLAEELATNHRSCTVAIFHHPRFSSGEHGDDAIVDPFWRALYAAGADVIVNGHDHDYERFAPQDPDAREDREAGIRQFVVGTGGARLRGFREPEPNSELRASVAHGVLALTLRDGSYAWRFHTVDSGFSDAGATTCH